MGQNHVGTETIKRLRAEGTTSVTAMDGLLAEVGRDLGLKLYRNLNPHPISYMRVAADWLARDDRFETTLIRAHNIRGHSCTIRCFWIRDKPQSGEVSLSDDDVSRIDYEPSEATCLLGLIIGNQVDFPTADFWGNADRTGECWNWDGKLNPGGYGQFTFKGTVLLAHRVAFALGHQTNPWDMFVCHRCDNPKCVNPDHLFLGTLQDNNMDRHIKGRTARKGPNNPARGSRNANARLTASDVRLIKRRLLNGEEGKAIADEYGVYKGTISCIKTGRSWRHVEPAPQNQAPNCQHVPE